MLQAGSVDIACTSSDITRIMSASKGSELAITSSIDSDCAGCSRRRSSPRRCILQGGPHVEVLEQDPDVALCSAEAELIATVMASHEVQ